MAQSDERRVALRFALTAVGWLGCVFGWVSVLSFSAADPPSDSVWPPRAPPANWCGPAGAWLVYYIFYYFGAGAYALLALLTVLLVTWTKAERLRDPWMRLIGVVLVCGVASTASAMLIPVSDRYLMTGPGGVVGGAGAHFFRQNFQSAGAYIVLACAGVVGLVLAADQLVLLIVRWLGWTSRRSIPVLARGGSAVASAGAAVATGVLSGVANLSTRLNANGRRRAAPAVQRDEPADRDEFEGVPLVAPKQLRFEVVDTEDTPAARSALTPAVTRSNPGEGSTPAVQEPPTRKVEIRPLSPKEAARPAATPSPAPMDQNYRLPTLDLLEPPVPFDKASIEILCREKAYVLEQTLNEFRVGVEVVAIETGPVITVFELKLAPGVKVSQIAALTNDMARALKAPAVRVVAPLPGKNTIGIEVPNLDKEKVRLRDVLELFGRRAEGYAIPLYLGKDASGQPLVSDLTRMPHLLIAGTTGSGKSVCVSSLIVSMLMTRTPSEISLLLVDPKMVELAAYKEISHLICPIITDVTKAESILDWATTLMDERYALLAEAGVRDIRSYNRLGREGLRQRLDIASDDELDRIPHHLPYIVIVIDELADLMMTAAKEVEFNLCRLAQKSRAVGIHMIVSTQRPQANVVTGLIKSNLPCRICFRVSSRLDSRIVLDQNGGETLLGQGDMLFLAPGTSKLIRAQGTFVSDEELRKVVQFCRAQRPPQYHPELVRMPGSGVPTTGERDELFDPAVEIVLETGRGSVSLLQRRLTIGYGRASRLIDQMYEAGIVGEYKGSQAREVIITKDEWEAMRTQRDRDEASEATDSPTP